MLAGSSSYYMRKPGRKKREKKKSPKGFFENMSMKVGVIVYEYEKVVMWG